MDKSLDAWNIVRPLVFFSFHNLTTFYSQNMGQNCIGIERLIVHSDQYDDLHDKLEALVKKLRTGSVLAPSPEGYVSTIDCGSMISGDRFRSLEKVLNDATESGANVEGGVQYNHAYLENGCYFTPTLVGPVDPTMEIAQVECMFWPSCGVGTPLLTRQ